MFIRQLDGLVAPFVPRDWQTEAKEHFLRSFSLGHDYEYIQAPPGTGKTALMALSGEEASVSGTRVIVVGKAKLVKQHREKLVEYGWKPVAEGEENASFASPAGFTWIVVTWQAAARAALKEPRKFTTEPCGILYFDECHLGGSNDSNVSFPRIVHNLQPAKRVYVSATSNIASETLLGARRGHIYVYPMSRAYADGLLNPVVMNEIHTGVRAQIRLIEGQYGHDFEDLQGMSSRDLNRLRRKNNEQIRGESLVGDDLHDLAIQMRDKGVEIEESGIERIILNRYKSMIAVYFAKHVGESAIFFCTDIEWANKAADWFNARAMKLGRDLRSFAVHTEADEFEQRIADFELPVTDPYHIPVLFVVGMLQEGFDLPRLALAFDCRFYRRWNETKIARLLQKLGRLTRKSAGKGESSYYFARDLQHYYKTKVFNPEVPNLGDADVVDEAISDDASDEEFVKDANVAATTIEVTADGRNQVDKPWAEDVVVPQTTLEEVPIDPEEDLGAEAEVDRTILETRRVKIAKTKLFAYELVDARDHRHVRTIPYTQLFGTTADKYKRALLASKSKKPPGYKSPFEGPWK
jgi:superfamily II DNA or RNA helicase